VLTGISLSHTVAFDFGALRVNVKTNSSELTQRLADYFRSQLVPASPDALEIIAVQAPATDFGLDYWHWPREGGKVGKKEAVCDLPGGRVVHKVKTGMTFLLGESVRLAVGDCEKNDNQIINFVIAQQLSRVLNRDAVLCHAAGVCEKGRGLMIAATSGAGKSTLAMHLMRHGATFVSNDRVVVEARSPIPVMHGVPKQPRVNPGTLLNNSSLEGILPPARVEALRALPRDELWQLEEKYDVDVERVYGPGRWVLSHSLDTFLILNWSRSSSSPATFQSVDLRKRPDLLELVVKSPGPFHSDAQGRFATGRESHDFEAYLQHLSRIPCFEAAGGVDFAAGVEWWRRLAELRS
jgi:HprK-related kinase B